MTPEEVQDTLEWIQVYLNQITDAAIWIRDHEEVEGLKKLRDQLAEILKPLN